jgi:hypothetical protein
MLSAVVAKHRQAFARYLAQTQASVAERLGWFIGLGAGVAAIANHLSRIEGALRPRYEPLVALFERVLGQLLPDRAAVFRCARFFNYELEEVHEDAFAAVLGPEVDQHKWPCLFIKLPTGLLDSPRSHVLVGHELGHAIAAVARADTAKSLRLSKAARRGGTVPPPAVPPLLPSPEPVYVAEVYAVTVLRWVDRGLIVPTYVPSGPIGTEQLLFMDQFAATMQEFQMKAERWLEELFADAIGTCLFGPAFVFAFLEFLAPTALFERGTKDHPPHGTRIIFMDSLLRDSRCGDFATCLPSGMLQRLDSLVAQSHAALARFPGVGLTPAEQTLLNALLWFVSGAAAQVKDIAISRCGVLTYKAGEFANDMRRYVDDLVRLGIPPIGVPMKTRASLASLFNVAQVVAMERRAEFRETLGFEEKEMALDHLIRKAIELAEFQLLWEEA